MFIIKKKNVIKLLVKIRHKQSKYYFLLNDICALIKFKGSYRIFFIYKYNNTFDQNLRYTSCL